MLHIRKIRPMFTSIVVTAEKFKEDMIDNGVIVAQKGDLKLWQRVVAIGSSVRDINVGDMVMINAENYIVRKYDKNSIQNDLDNNPKVRFNFRFVDIDDENGKPQECILLNDRDVLYVFEGEDIKEDSAGKIILPNKTLLVN